MNIQPKIEPGSSSSTNHVILVEGVENDNLQDKTIPDLIEVLRGAYLTEVFDRVEGVLVSRDVGLRDQTQRLQQNVDMERLKLQEELEMEKLARIKAEEELKKREEIFQKGKKVQERYEALLKKVKTDLSDRDTVVVLRKRNIELRELFEEGKITIGELTKKNNELKCEVQKLKEKRVEDGNELDMLRKKKVELDNEVLELNKKSAEDGNAIDMLKTKSGELECEVEKLKEKMVEDGNANVLKRKNCELESKVLELEKLKEKWLDDSTALNELRSKVGVLEDEKNALAGIEIKNSELKETVNTNLAIISELRNENRKLADEKCKGEILLESLNTKFRTLHERVARLEDGSNLSMSVDASGGGNDEGDGEDVGGNEVGNEIVEKSAPLQRNGVGHHSHGVVASTQPLNKGSKDASLESEVKGASSGMGTMKVKKDIEIIHLDDDDDDEDWRMSQGVHEKKAIYGLVVKNEYPSPSLVVQQKTKFANAVDTVKRKFSFSDSETSTSSSSSSSFSDDLSFLDNLTTRSITSLAKEKKM
ncbi:WEB family protein At4g27595, chloroplastic isoform X2 [Medicago truncatula]|uniref:WEB family protein At4g27595, chloroplastic isoform X2 n=1 Tax=Medicago truncatula TaxID=3880 RepID=UPI001967808B|nr:WEB family protein At4g27595, chloroplastic isoform X2 [Medicago truncatula]